MDGGDIDGAQFPRDTEETGCVWASLIVGAGVPSLNLVWAKYQSDETAPAVSTSQEGEKERFSAQLDDGKLSTHPITGDIELRHSEVVLSEAEPSTESLWG